MLWKEFVSFDHELFQNGLGQLAVLLLYEALDLPYRLVAAGNAFQRLNPQEQFSILSVSPIPLVEQFLNLALPFLNLDLLQDLLDILFLNLNIGNLAPLLI